MTYEFNGLPLHILLVHAVVVIVPLTALCTAATMVWPMARRRLGLLTPALGIACVALVFVTMKAGEWLLLRVAQTPAILQHANDGRTLLPWAWALMGAAIVAWFWHRLAMRARLRARIGPRFAATVAVLVTVAVLLACVGITADVAVIGEAGSRAVWGGLLGS
ncbi:hypothetical protein AL755_11695 [Arthrobacter sp. ERGS1:01]|uniref:DUF2231 domain-containing protein n=1 Tax=Arthrobacter sp. ERGS1:01 TaxID=1704044 RepID=UPI0006B53B47|nr:DUF2231 domain-containing protein [Arthrobacter sp. ERGS1:01]ALE05979.1 hypothetical protein AL755_11695 [Arthrobacter sp. ERGS1:01]